MADQVNEPATGDGAPDGLDDGDREELLRAEYLGQTARIPWVELQPHYARGAVIVVTDRCNLIEVAVQLALDNTALFQSWIEAGDIAGVSDEQALAWFENKAALWAVVAAPWVLVQETRPEALAATAPS